MTSLFSFIAWYLLSSLAGLLGLPLAFKLFSRLPGKGYAFARSLGMLVVVYLFWLLGSLHLLDNSGMAIVLCALLVGIGGIAWLGRAGWNTLREWLKAEWKAVLAIEVVFLVAFAGWTLIRMYNPEILGTEKPMEFMFLNAILRSPQLPPQDAWLSGYAISYYYFGYLIVACLTRLSGAPPGVAFNLAQSLWFALVATGALGVMIDCMALILRSTIDPGEQHYPRLVRTFPAALLAPVIVLLIGNLYGILGLANQNGLAANTRIPALYYDFGKLSQDQASLEKMPGVRLGMVNFWEWLDLKQLPPGFSGDGRLRLDLYNWFFAARVIHDRGLTGVEVEAIDENPAFSFLLGDLHPHVLALPFVLLVIALGFESLLWAGAVDPINDDHPPVRLVLAGIILGSLLVLNTWDFPIYALLLMLALGSGFLRAKRDANHLKNIAIRFVAIIGLSVLLYVPFFLTFQSQAGGILPNVLYPTRFQQLLVMFAPVLVPAIIFLAWMWRRGRYEINRYIAWLTWLGFLLFLSLLMVLLAWLATRVKVAQPFIAQLIAPFSWSQALGLIASRRLVDSLAALLMSGMLAVSAGLLVGKSHKEPVEPSPLKEPALLMALCMILVGAFLVLVPEFVYLRDNFGIRMNTLFKFYFQAWILWGLAGCFGCWYIYRRSKPGWRVAVVFGLGLPVLLGSVYLPASLASKTQNFSQAPTLDGMAYFAKNFPGDWAAIQWLNQNAQPGDVILEGTRGAYWVEGRSSRISMATGLPTLLGWANHEAQWRGAFYASVASREDDIRSIYSLSDWQTTRELLQRYQVKYIIVSELEREWYKPLREQKFKVHTQTVFQSGNLTIYQYR